MEKRNKDDQNVGFFSLENTTEVCNVIMKKMNSE